MKITEIDFKKGKKYKDSQDNLIWEVDEYERDLFLQDGTDITEHFILNAIANLDFVEYIEDIDWAKIEIDTKVLVSMTKNFNKGVKKHFAGVFDGKPCVWSFGNTSWTTDVVVEWDYIKLAEEEKE